MSEKQPPDYDDEECDDGILPTDENSAFPLTHEQEQGVRDLNSFFAQARDQH